MRHLCISLHKGWLWQFSVNLPFYRFIIDDVLERDITHVPSAFPDCFAVFICFAHSSSDDKEPSILKNQTKVNDISFELFSFLPSFRLNVKYETCIPSK